MDEDPTQAGLRNASFTFPDQLREAIDRFPAIDSKKAHPFERTNTPFIQKTKKTFRGTAQVSMSR